MKATIELSFSVRGELERVVFAHPLLSEPRVCSRGKGLDGPISVGSFQWTQAVRALAFLLVKQAAVSPDVGSISGGSRSLAASLDYAISKQPRWVREMFGEDRRGRALIHRIISRSNPERKRPGPVTLALRRGADTFEEIVIRMNGEGVVDAQRLRLLVEHLSEISPIGVLGERGTERLACPARLISPEYVGAAFVRQVREALSSIDVFSEAGYRAALRGLMRDPSVARRMARRKFLVSEIDQRLSARERLGLGLSNDELRAAINRQEPLRCVVSMNSVATLAILEYLRSEQGFYVGIDYEWSYAVHIRRAIRAGAFREMPDLFVLGSGPATTFLKDSESRNFAPFMLAPSLTHNILSGRGAASARRTSPSYGQYALLCEEATTSLFCLEAVAVRAGLSQRRLSATHIEPEAVPLRLPSAHPDERFITFFPPELCGFFGSWQHVPGLSPQATVKENIVFASKAFLHDEQRARSFDIAFRNAWLELRDDPRRCAAIVRRVTAEQRFYRSVLRFSGLHCLPHAQMSIA